MSARSPLLVLLRLRWRGRVRRFLRMVRTPRGLLTVLAALAGIGLWLAGALARARIMSHQAFSESDSLAMARAALVIFAVVIVSGALSYRGLYIPEEEVERLLSAPVTRRELIRYRLLPSLFAASLFALIFSIELGARMPVPLFGFLGAFLAVMTLPILGQAVAIGVGDAESRLGRLVGRLPGWAPRFGALVAILLLLVALFGGDGPVDRPVLPRGTGPMGFFLGLAHAPIFTWAGLPALPWARAMAAPGSGEFALWFGFALALSVLLFEVTTRLPCDFRELSLATSAQVAARRRRMGAGRNLVAGMGGLGGKAAKGLRAPWLLGSGPFGALAWIQLTCLWRTAKGTLLLGLVTVGVALLFTLTTLSEPVEGALFLALWGVIYITSGLRFDFRGNLERIEIMRTWPVSSRRIFLATILPEIGIVTLLVTFAELGRLAYLGEWSLTLGLIIAGIPWAVALWVIVDNVVFLWFPVRYQRGQSAATQHTGRLLLVTLVRLAILLVSGLIIGMGAAGAFALAKGFDVGEVLALTIAVGVAFALSLFSLWAGVVAGGWSLERFDPAAPGLRGSSS